MSGVAEPGCDAEPNCTANPPSYIGEYNRTNNTLVKNFLACRQLFQDRKDGEYILISPVWDVVLPQFPGVTKLNFFLHVISLRGLYRAGIRTLYFFMPDSRWLF